MCSIYNSTILSTVLCAPGVVPATSMWTYMYILSVDMYKCLWISLSYN